MIVRGRPDPKAPRPPLRERLAAMRLVPRLIGLVWQTHRGYTAAMIVLRVTRSFVPVTSLWVGKLIIDEVIRLARVGGESRHLWMLVALEMATVVTGELLARTSGLIESLLGDRFTNRMSVRLMEHAATLDLHQFEDPKFYDRLERARQGTAGRVALLSQLLGMGQSMLTLISLSVALAAQAPWLLVLLALAVLPSFLGETHFAALSYALLFRWTPERRQLDYVRYIGASDRTAKEVQLFGLAPWLIDRYRALSDRFYAENRSLVIRKALVSSLLSLVGTAGYYAAYVVVLVRAMHGAITIGTLTFLAASFRQSRDLIQSLLMSASGIYEQSLYLKDLFDFFDMQPSIKSKPGALAVPKPHSPGLRVRGRRLSVSGQRAMGGAPSLVRDPPGRAGRPRGRERRGEDHAHQAPGAPLRPERRADPSRRRGPSRVRPRRRAPRDRRDLPGFRALRHALRRERRRRRGRGRAALSRRRAVEHERRQPPEAIARAAEKSLAASLLPKLPGSYRQMLGRRFDDGVDLSGGEWQKVALARAYMRDAQLLILDEPTAALDARAEYDVFLRFNALMAGRMAVVISHRFSTVRMADRIVVLTKGEIVEQGTHDQLVTSGGLYAELFAMQAAGYR